MPRNTHPGPIVIDGPAIPARPTVAVAERPALLLEALGRMLTASGFEVTALCLDGEALLRKLRMRRAQVVLVDAGVDGDRPLQLLGRVREVAPDARCVALVPVLTPELALAAAREDADGVIEGSCSSAALAEAIRQVAAGHAVFPAGWMSLLRRARAESLDQHLSVRQLQVLELLSSGLTNEQIADALSISRNTVKFHLREIYARAGVANRVQAARMLAGRSPSGLAPEETAA